MNHNFINAFKEKPETMSHVILKEQGVKVDIIIGSKLLKIKVKDFIKQDEPITNQNLKDASVLCRCDCSNFCIFTVGELADPDVMPACDECNAELDRYLWEQTQQGRTLTRLEAWQENGVVRNEIQYSRVFMDFTDRSNSLTAIKNHHNVKMSASELNLHGIDKRNLLSALHGRNTALSTPDNLILNYACICDRFCLLDQSVYGTPEPIGMCSACAHELKYSFNNPKINTATQKLSFKIIWKNFLTDHGYPFIPFKPVWIDYLAARKLSRKRYIELHLKDFLKTYDFASAQKALNEAHDE